MRGVYAIENTLNGTCYVGGSSDLDSRWRQHRGALARGAHYAKRLQLDWDTQGADTFAFRVVEVVDAAEQLREREQCWLTHYANCGLVYNATPDIHSRGRILTDEQIRQAAEGRRGKPQPESARKAISEALRTRERKPESARATGLAKRRYGMSETHRQAVAHINAGKQRTPEQLEHLRAGHRAPYPTPEQQDDLRRRYAGGESARALARETGISITRVSRIVRGLAKGHIRLTADDVRAIRRRAQSEPRDTLAAEYALTRGYVNDILARRAWAFVPDEPAM